MSKSTQIEKNFGLPQTNKIEYSIELLFIAFFWFLWLETFQAIFCAIYSVPLLTSAGLLANDKITVTSNVLTGWLAGAFQSS